MWKASRLSGGREGLDDDYGTAVTGADGRLYFAMVNDGHPLYVGDLAADRVVPIARLGSGPGEVRYPSLIRRGRGDSLFVLDRSLTRMNVFSPTGKFVRSIPLVLSVDDFVPLANGTFVVAAQLGGREAFGQPLHLVGADGQRVKSFGLKPGQPPDNTTKGQYRQRRWIALARDGSVFAVRTGGYVLERWSPEGTLLMERDVAPEWFTPKHEVRSLNPLEQPPPPFVTSIQEGDDGRVWVLAVRADANWKRGIQASRLSRSGYTVPSFAAYMDSQVDVFDAKTFDRVATYRSDQPLGVFVAPGVAASAKAAVDDAPVIDLWRMRVVGK